MRSTSRFSIVLPIAAVALVAAGVTVAASASGVAAIDGAAAANASAERIENQTQTQEPSPAPQPQSAQYLVTVISDWSSSSHPTTRPSNSHFSPIVVAVHGEPGRLFASGRVASPGIEQMAETGGTSTLRSELSADSLVADVRVGTSIFGEGQNAFEVTARQSTDRLSTVTMLAPSPDWFVGASDVDLFVDGAWVERLEIDLSNYDAGTDSGSSWTSANADTDPAQTVSGPRDASFAAGAAEGSFGRLVIERI